MREIERGRERERGRGEREEEGGFFFKTELFALFVWLVPPDPLGRVGFLHIHHAYRGLCQEPQAFPLPIYD